MTKDELLDALAKIDRKLGRYATVERRIIKTSASSLTHEKSRGIILGLDLARREMRKLRKEAR